MASGSSDRPNSPGGSKGFDFTSDDILCSYEDYGNQDSPKGSHADAVIASNSTEDFQKIRMSRSCALPTTHIYSRLENSLNQELISTVDRTMKKYTDNLMRFLEGISSRISQFELYCYNLDKSIGEMRSDLLRDHGECETKLKSIDKLIQEVHQSVQIMRDKQELAETQEELAKLQLAQKESSSEGKNVTPEKEDDASEGNNKQLALALPHGVAPQPSTAAEQEQSVVSAAQTSPLTVNQPPYYMMPTHLPNARTITASPQGPYMPVDYAYHAPVAPQVNQMSPAPAYPRYPQEWPQRVGHPVQSPQKPPIQPQIQVRPPPAAYPAYMTSQPINPPPPETVNSSMPMQMPYSGIPQPGASHVELMHYGHGAVQPQHLKGGFAAQPTDGFRAAGPHLPVSPGGAYMLYDSSEGGRPQYSPGVYQRGSVPLRNQPPPSGAGAGPVVVHNQKAPQYVRNNHPHNELINKLVSMGYRGDHVASVIERLEESGQTVDFNAVLDRLNEGSAAGSQRGW